METENKVVEETENKVVEETENKVVEELKEKLKEYYADFGREVYRENKKNPAFRSKYADMLTKMEDVLSELNEIDAKELEAKGLKRCPQCECEVTLESRFCNMCGFNFASNAVHEESKPQQPAVCPHCGSPLEEDSVFCSRCGKHI